MVTPVDLWLREEGRMEDFYKMKDKIQYHFQSPVLPELEPVSVIKHWSIFAITTKDYSRTRAQVLSTNKDRSSLPLGDLGELAKVENEDLHQLLEVFQYEDFFSFKFPAGEWSNQVD